MKTLNRSHGIRLKIERAKHHVRDLESRLISFRRANPYRLVIENDPQTAERIYRIRIHTQIPPDLVLVAGEVIHHLRSSLDHLVWQLVEANGEKPGRQTYFPICETAAKYEEAKASKKVQGISPKAVNIIDSIQPYKGGNDVLWKLHGLNNYEKHRLLFIVACRVDDADVTITHGPPQPQAASIRLGAPVPILPSGAIRVLEDGTEFGRVAGHIHQDVNTNIDVRFEVVFSEPSIVRGEPVLACLQQLVRVVEGISNMFSPFL